MTNVPFFNGIRRKQVYNAPFWREQDAEKAWHTYALSACTYLRCSNYLPRMNKEPF